jgi:hypothetical protein
LAVVSVDPKMYELIRSSLEFSGIICSDDQVLSAPATTECMQACNFRELPALSSIVCMLAGAIDVASPARDSSIRIEHYSYRPVTI